MAELPKNILELRKRYQAAQARLIEIISQQEARGNVTAYRKALLANIEAELRALDLYAAEWLKNTIPPEYTGSLAGVFTYVNKAVPPSVVARSIDAVEIILDNALHDLTDAHRFVGRRVKDTLRKAGLDAVAQSLSIGDTVKQTKANMLNIMTDRGITAVRDSRGYAIPLDSYAEMVARTTTREATNQGTLQGCEEIGNDLVQITSHASACPVCAPLEGRVYSISGNDSRYPALSIAFPSGFHTLHPNCRHSIVPYIEKYDDNADATRANSNQPFDVDPRTQAQIDRYNAEQRVKASRRSDRNEWEQYRTLPDAPKTFSGFRAMKRANSEKYQNIREKFDA
jgi:hypothetical protein